MKMIAKFMFIFLGVFAVLGGPAQAANRDPIVLVHGWMGWGPSELGGYKYWGGSFDLEAELRKAGYEVYTASIGPVASNWDRSAELYAQIKGGTVDYGKAHSGYFGHDHISQKKTYPGLYPKWGEINPATGERYKVHFIAHSQGAQTVRMLAQLLEKGAPMEQGLAQADPSYKISPLFAGNADTSGWINGIATVSAPHDGNSLVYGMAGMIPDFYTFFSWLADKAPAGSAPAIDLKLDHWGVEKMPGEASVDFFMRAMLASPVAASLDSGMVDLSPEGAAYMNSWVWAQPNIYYFSLGTQKTVQGPEGYHVPLPGMNPYLKNASLFMGSLTGQLGAVNIDPTWWPNDGMVSVSSMDGPTLYSADVIVQATCEEDGVFQPGVWNYLGTLQDTDHYEVVGVVISPPAKKQELKNLLKPYLKLAKTLQKI